MASTLLIGSPPPTHVPTMQPLPGFHTQSAFAESSTSIPSSVYPPTTTVSYPPGGVIRSPEPPQSAPGYPSRAGYRPPPTPHRQYALHGGPPRPAYLPLLERAVESVQAHLAAITERLETLEGLWHHSSASLSASGLPRSPGAYGGVAPYGVADSVHWDIDDMGMWALVLRPLLRAYALARYALVLLAGGGPRRSPTFVVVRRLLLDVSFVLCVLAVFKAGWRRSGVRRREVVAALNGLWYAIVGQHTPRQMVERGV